MLLRVESTTLPELDGKDLITTTATIILMETYYNWKVCYIEENFTHRSSVKNHNMYSNMLDLSIQDMKASTTRVPINISFDRVVNLLG